MRRFMGNKKRQINFTTDVILTEDKSGLHTTVGVSILLGEVILKILPELKNAFYDYLPGEDNSWRIHRNWKSYKKTLEELC